MKTARFLLGAWWLLAVAGSLLAQAQEQCQLVGCVKRTRLGDRAEQEVLRLRHLTGRSQDCLRRYSCPGFKPASFLRYCGVRAQGCL